MLGVVSSFLGRRELRFFWPLTIERAASHQLFLIQSWHEFVDHRLNRCVVSAKGKMVNDRSDVTRNVSLDFLP